MLSRKYLVQCPLHLQGSRRSSTQRYKLCLDTCQPEQRTRQLPLVSLFQQQPDQYEFCLGQILTIEKYIRRRKDLSKIKSDAYLNFVKATKRILNLKRKNKFNEVEAGKLKNKVVSESNIIAKNWLLQKLS